MKVKLKKGSIVKKLKGDSFGCYSSILLFNVMFIVLSTIKNTKQEIPSLHP